ncbi:MAG: hypothetical protein ACI4EX_14265 [Lachnospiraceae bacterium]
MKKLVIPKINSINFGGKWRLIDALFGGKIPYYERHLKETIPFDPQKQYAVIRSSICTGEKVAGFKNNEDGHFTEVMLIKTSEDEKRFKKIYDIETVKKEY